MDYIEQDCIFESKGRKFEARGAVVTPDVIVAYLGMNSELKDWHGNVLGTWRAVSSWCTPGSLISYRMYQIEATVNGVTYTGRGAGEGMIYKGKRKKG